MSPVPSLSACVVLCCSFASVAALPAQCEPAWTSTGGIPGPDAIVNASVQWDPDGAGPLTPRVVLGGDFQLAGDAIASRIVAYEPTTRSWSAFGAGFAGEVFALAVLPNGELVAAGSFTAAGGSQANRIARWTGTAWAPLGAGCDGPVLALAVLPNGDLVAGGSFANAGGVPASALARWDGTTWTQFGGVTAFLVPRVNALAVAGNGDLLVGGRFTAVGGVATENIARWDGIAWSPLGTGAGASFYGENVEAIAVRPGGEVVAGGTFTVAGGVTVANVAQWNGTNWSALGIGVPAAVSALPIEPAGTLLAGSALRVTRWNGSAWAQVGAGVGIVRTLAVLPNGTIVACGTITSAAYLSTYAQRFDGVAWTPLSAGIDFLVDACAVLPNGDLVVGGAFTAAGGLGTDRVARRSGGQWLPLGSGVNGGVNALAVLPNGDLVAGGGFTAAGGVPCNRIARWDGTAWSPLGSGMDNIVRDLVVMPNGDLVAVGAFTTAGGVPCSRIARWNGTTWSSLGSGFTSTFFLFYAEALCLLPNGDLVAAGPFTHAGGVAANGIARWDGSSWHALGAGVQSVQALAVLPDGQLVAGGAFQQAGGTPASCIARWNGSSWSPLGGGLGSAVNALLPLPDGQLVVAGNFETASGVAARHIARWNGSSWSAFGAGLGGVGASVGNALARLPDGVVVVGGWFRTAGALVSSNVALLTPTCPALASPSGTGCAGAGGTNVLAARTLPWLGTTFTTVGTGMPPLGVVVGVRGLATTNIQLAQLLPQGLSGCGLLVSPDLLDAYLPNAGSVTTQLVLPVASTLLGQVLHQQLVPLELTATGSISAATASNALTATIGTF